MVKKSGRRSPSDLRASASPRDPSAASNASLSPAQITAGAAARDQANASTPRVVLAAFEPDPVTIRLPSDLRASASPRDPSASEVFSLALQPMTVSTFMILEKLSSPLIRESASTMGSMDVARAIYVLSQPLPKVRAALAGGPQAFDDAVWALCDAIPVAAIQELGQAIRRHVEHAFSTVIGASSPSGTALSPSKGAPPRESAPSADSKETAGTDPLPPSPGPATGSAGA